jgi:hypothetical protein
MDNLSGSTSLGPVGLPVPHEMLVSSMGHLPQIPNSGTIDGAWPSSTQDYVAASAPHESLSVSLFLVANRFINNSVYPAETGR